LWRSTSGKSGLRRFPLGIDSGGCKPTCDMANWHGFTGRRKRTNGPDLPAEHSERVRENYKV
jgi:hypothetical protein